MYTELTVTVRLKHYLYVSKSHIQHAEKAVSEQSMNHLKLISRWSDNLQNTINPNWLINPYQQ